MADTGIYTPQRIIGIDPGSQVVGYAVIEEKRPNPINPRDFKIIAAGAIKARDTLTCTQRIGHLHEALFQLALEFQPRVCIMEQSFIGINAGSSLKLGEARGSLMSAMHRHSIPIFQVTPTRVKKTITGKGGATKKEVAICLKALVGFELGKLPYDVSDALAIALYHGMAYASAKIATPLESTRASFKV